MAVVAFIGLGNMGYPMAGHLVAAGHEVRVFNRTATVAAAWAVQHGSASAHRSPAAAAQNAEFVISCVGADDDVREVLRGDDGALKVLSPGAVVIDHTTASANLARELFGVAAERGIGFLDAPISGGQVGAENGELSVMCGGEASDFSKARPLLSCYSKVITLLGPAGSGQLTKMVNQILCAGAIQGAAEALAFGEQAGLNMDLVLQAVAEGAAGSWYLSNRGETMINDEFDFGFAVDLMLKDLNLVHSEASAMSTHVPLTELLAAYLRRGQAAGDNRMDATAIIRQYRLDNGAEA